jgi:hypothetical protein
VALLDISDGLPMQIALSLGGILMMIVAAMLLNSIRIKPKRQPTHDDALAHGDFRLVRSLNFLKSSWRILRARRLVELRKTRRWAAAL